MNAQAVANAQILESKKSDIRYKNGRTLRASASKLLADARRKELEHSAILSDNMIADGQTRPGDVAAHHIVSWSDPPAFDSQQLLFGWGIGINDVDNGAYLPRFKKTVVDTLPNARKHSPPHTYIYHAQVYGRLLRIEPERKHSETARKTLRNIKAELVAGTFPYRKEHLV